MKIPRRISRHNLAHFNARGKIRTVTFSENRHRRRNFFKLRTVPDGKTSRILPEKRGKPEKGPRAMTLYGPGRKSAALGPFLPTAGKFFEPKANPASKQCADTSERRLKTAKDFLM